MTRWLALCTLLSVSTACVDDDALELEVAELPADVVPAGIPAGEVDAFEVERPEPRCGTIPPLNQPPARPNASPDPRTPGARGSRP